MLIERLALRGRLSSTEHPVGSRPLAFVLALLSFF